MRPHKWSWASHVGNKVHNHSRLQCYTFLSAWTHCSCFCEIRVPLLDPNLDIVPEMHGFKAWIGSCVNPTRLRPIVVPMHKHTDCLSLLVPWVARAIPNLLDYIWNVNLLGRWVGQPTISIKTIIESMNKIYMLQHVGPPLSNLGYSALNARFETADNLCGERERERPQR